jgi:hypothetical protein
MKAGHPVKASSRAFHDLDMLGPARLPLTPRPNGQESLVSAHRAHDCVRETVD